MKQICFVNALLAVAMGNGAAVNWCPEGFYQCPSWCCPDKWSCGTASSGCHHPLLAPPMDEVVAFDIGEVVHATWDCRFKHMAVIGTDTTGEPAELQTCMQACNGTPTCLAVYWRQSDNNCHLLEGSFTKSQWEDKLSSDSEYQSCFKVGVSEDLLV